MTEKNIEELLDELIAEASEPVIKALTEEDLKHLDDAYPYEISKEHEEKMKEIFKQAGYAKSEGTENESIESGDVDVEKTASGEREDEKHNVEEFEFANSNIGNSTKRSKIRKFWLVAAILVAVLAIGCVGAFRDSFVKYYLEIKQECSGVKNNITSQFCEVENIHFDYMPSEYELFNKKIEKDSIKLVFRNDINENYFTLSISDREYTRDINTENAIIEELVINEKDMIYSEIGELRLISWKEKGKILVLCTNDTKELIIKVAENISILE